MRQRNKLDFTTLLILAYVCCTQCQKKIRVLKNNLNLADDGKALSGARVDENRRVSDIKDITFCIRFNFKLLGGWNGRSQLINIEDWKPDKRIPEFGLLWFGANFPYSFFAFGYPRKKGSYKSFLLRDPQRSGFEVWATNRWSHVCLSYEKNTGHLRIVKDGNVTNIDSGDPDFTGVTIPDDFLPKIYLARCPFNYSFACSAPEGQIADFNVWRRALTVEEAKDWTSCRNMFEGDVIKWSEVKLEIINMTETFETVKSICVPPRPGHVLFPMKRNFTAHRALCSKMRGVTSVIKDGQTQETMNKEMEKYPSCGNSHEPVGRYWAGWWDEPAEGNFSNVNTGKALSSQLHQPWYLGEPNGDTLENCAMVWPARNAWNDVRCDDEYCAFCELEAAPDIRIRGLCHGSKLDVRYSWTQEMVNGRHSFRGYKDTILFYDRAVNEWRMELYSDPSVVATTSGPEYPFGTHTWRVVNESCYDQEELEVQLNINACQDTEYNCVDGFCIDISQRCDGKVHCPDRTDEIDCVILSAAKSYIKEVPPPAMVEGELAEITASIDILSILDIKEVENVISLQLQLQLSWIDNRLTMSNLKDDKNLNTLTLDFRSRIWIPEIVFYNTQDKMESKNDKKAFATITREGGFVPSPGSQLENAYIFKGAENPITISRVYDSEFLCEFNMASFPFDTQICSVVMVMKGNSGNFVRMVKGALNYLGPIDLTQYFIKKVTMSETTILSDTFAVKVDIVFGRRILATILTTYLPTFLLCIVCFSTNYFKAFFFEAVVTVNLTSLLVLTTLFISVFNSLPTTAYVKMIDLWLIFNLLVPFFEVLLHTFIDSLREEARDINHHGKSVSIGDHEKSEAATHPKISTNGKVFKMSNKVRPDTSRNIDLISRDEEKEVKARKEYYDHAGSSNERHMKIATKVARVGLPVVFFAFIVLYFVIGMTYYLDQYEGDAQE